MATPNREKPKEEEEEEVYRLKTHKIVVLAFHKIAVSRKTKPFDAFWVFFLDCMDP